MDLSELKSLFKDKISEKAKELSISDVAFLIEVLEEKDEKARYHAFLLLQAKSQASPLVYAHWDTLEKKLDSPNATQRSLGLMLLSENVRWDSEGKFSRAIDGYLDHCTDERFVTARQAIQGLANIIRATNMYNSKIKQRVASLSFEKYKETQQSLLRRDAANILALMN
ncbi:MAG: hypothetical protein NWE98_06730 [Candidatus Bathyarchaeota archaeon]|nr:hypothetical protein [Candidatus Bathyarchaeota archaeon]